MKRILFLCISTFSLVSYGNVNFYKLAQKKVRKDITSKIRYISSLSPEEEREARLAASKEDQLLKKYIRKLLKRYKTYVTSVAVIDNNTNTVIAHLDYNGKTKKFGQKITRSSTHPAASIFKIITAASLLESDKVDLTDTFSFNGKSTTLYKSQLKNKKNKWSRSQSLLNAFAKSNNVIFGKSALDYLSPNYLFNTAKKFLFNMQLFFESKNSSKTFFPKTSYELAEMASGFNKKTLISPIHGAMIANIISNDGMAKDFALPGIGVTNFGEHRVIKDSTAKSLRKAMAKTVKAGTARSSFRRNRRLMKKIDIGGKTGSITGGLPFGKRDWFVSYASPHNGDDKGISLAVMIINDKKWHVRSTYLAKKIIEYYYSKTKV